MKTMMATLTGTEASPTTQTLRDAIRRAEYVQTLRDAVRRAGGRDLSRPYNAVITVLAGCILVIASISPWLADPLEGNFATWRLPIDIGWQFPAALTLLFNYGALCLCCAIFCFVAAWRSYKGRIGAMRWTWLVCLSPLILFVLQYLCIDMQATNQLAQHQLQWLLITRHFGYNVTPLRIGVKPFDIDASTIQGRTILLVQQISFGAFLSCLSALVAWWGQAHARRQSGQSIPQTSPGRGPRAGAHAPTLLRRGDLTVQGTGGAPALGPRPGRRRLLLLIGGIFLLIVLGRAPLGTLCQYEASNLLVSGNYSNALGWLNAAAFLNPSLAQVAPYHIERGQALYFLYGDEKSDDSRTYLAYTYRQQNNDLSAYEQLFAVWQGHPGTPWVRDELSITLAKLAEFIHPINSPPLQRPIRDDSALPWLEILARVDSINVYAQYATARIQYDLHNYTMTIAQMNTVLSMSGNSDILSSAYTYLALSADGQQRFTDERNLLNQAVKFDTGYHNNTAREALSGLH